MVRAAKVLVLVFTVDRTWQELIGPWVNLPLPLSTMRFTHKDIKELIDKPGSRNFRDKKLKIGFCARVGNWINQVCNENSSVGQISQSVGQSVSQSWEQSVMRCHLRKFIIDDWPLRLLGSALRTLFCLFLYKMVCAVRHFFSHRFRTSFGVSVWLQSESPNRLLFDWSSQ